MVEHVQHHRVHNDRPEFLHEIQGQGRTAIDGTVQVAHNVIETHQLYRTGHLVGEQRVAKTEQGVNRVSWGPPDSPGKGPLLLVSNELAKAAKVGGTACSFHADNGFQRSAFYPMVSA